MRILIILICWRLALTTFVPRKCHNYYSGKHNILCAPMKNTRNYCQNCIEYDLLGRQNVTICSTDPFAMTVAEIISLIPRDTENLIIDYNNTWFGHLPTTPDPINITGIVHLKQLRYFQIDDKLYQYYQAYPLLFERDALPLLLELKNLTTFRIRLPITQHKIHHDWANFSAIISQLPNLHFLDLSYTRGFTRFTLPHILDALNNSQLVHLCLRRIQLPGSSGFQDNMTNIFDYKKYKLPTLGELDLSDNLISLFPTGLERIAPSLELLDMSGNNLIDVSNMGFFLEIIQHPYLKMLNYNYQGRYEMGPRTSWSWHKKCILNHTPQYKKYFLNELKYLIYCFNMVRSNVSDILSSGNYSCQFVKCLLPKLFAQCLCDNVTVFPPLNRILCFDCYGFVNVPIGKRLETLFINHVHFEQTGTTFIKLFGILSISEENQLKTLEFRSNDIWIINAELQHGIDNLYGIKNLNNLTYLDLTNNRFKISINDPFIGQLNSLKILNLSQNQVKTTEYCKIMPQLQELNLSSSALDFIHKNMIRNCTNLKIIDLSNNKMLDSNSLKNLSFEGVYSLTHINLKGNMIDYLSSKTINDLNKFPNLTISLYDNRLYCNCSNESQIFTEWLLQKASHGKVIDYDIYDYYCSGPSGTIFYKNIKLEKLYADCVNSQVENIIYSIITTLGFIGFMGVCGLFYRVRWRIKYFSFKIQQKCKKTKHTDDTKWIYDVFVSYCAQDRFWVHDTLVKELETKYGFQLCIHYRDFPVGNNIADTIGEKMSESREIIIILSDLAVQSSWCQFELDQALVQIGCRQKSLIIITLGDLHKNCLNARVAHVLENHTYMKWSENPKANKSFWSLLVARLYNDPRGNMCLTRCCCPYGANALGYQDIFDQECDYDDEYIPQDFKNCVSDAEKKCQARMQTYERKSKQARRFWKVVNSSLEENDISHWVFGQLPWPVMQLLGDKKQQLDAHRKDFTKARSQLLLKCLENEQQKLMQDLERERARLNEIMERVILESLQRREAEKVCVYTQQ